MKVAILDVQELIQHLHGHAQVDSAFLQMSSTTDTEAPGYQERPLVADEGGNLGGISPFVSVAECAAMCDSTSGCKSFAVCQSGPSGCWMKDKLVSAGSATSTNEAALNTRNCKTHYQVPIIGGMDINVSAVPTNPVPVDCIPTTKCTLIGNPNCQKLKDRFILVQSGIRDKRDEFDQALKDKITYCVDQERQYNEQINDLNIKLRQENTKLAQGTQDQNEAETGSHQASGQHRTAATEYVRSMKECCDNKNTYRSELCALGKIRA